MVNEVRRLPQMAASADALVSGVSAGNGGIGCNGGTASVSGVSAGNGGIGCNGGTASVSGVSAGNGGISSTVRRLP
jgi:hypothetical protein